jgi:hypothetical protein
MQAAAEAKAKAEAEAKADAEKAAQQELQQLESELQRLKAQLEKTLVRSDGDTAQHPQTQKLEAEVKILTAQLAENNAQGAMQQLQTRQLKQENESLLADKRDLVLRCTNMNNELQKLQLEAHLLKQSQEELTINRALPENEFQLAASPPAAPSEPLVPAEWTAAVSWNEAVPFTLTLDVDFNSIGDHEAFKQGVIKDVGTAANLSAKYIKIAALRAGSVIVEMLIASEAGEPTKIVQCLLEQFKTPDSLLMKGKFTSTTKSLTPAPFAATAHHGARPVKSEAQKALRSSAPAKARPAAAPGNAGATCAEGAGTDGDEGLIKFEARKTPAKAVLRSAAAPVNDGTTYAEGPSTDGYGVQSPKVSWAKKALPLVVLCIITVMALLVVDAYWSMGQSCSLVRVAVDELQRENNYLREQDKLYKELKTENMRLFKQTTTKESDAKKCNSKLESVKSEIETLREEVLSERTKSVQSEANWKIKLAESIKSCKSAQAASKVVPVLTILGELNLIFRLSLCVVLKQRLVTFSER